MALHIVMTYLKCMEILSLYSIFTTHQNISFLLYLFSSITNKRSFLSAVGAYYFVIIVHGEGFPYEGCLALFTVEALVMPLPGLKGNIFCVWFARLTKNRLIAFITLGSKLFSKAVCAETLALLEIESCVMDRFTTSRTGEALRVPGLITV